MSEYPMFQPAANAPTVTDTQQLYQPPTPFSPSRYRNDLINADMEETPPTLFGCPERWRNMTSSALFTNAPATPHGSPPIFRNLLPHSTAAATVMQPLSDTEMRGLSITQCTADLDFNMAGLDADFARLENIVQQSRHELAKTLEEQRKRRQGMMPGAEKHMRINKASRKQGWLETEFGIMGLSARAEAPSRMPMGPNGRYGSGAIRKKGRKQIPFSERKPPGGSGNTNVATFQFGRGRGSPPGRRNGAAGQSSIEMCDEALRSFQFTDTDESYPPHLPDMTIFDEESDMADLADASLFSERHHGILPGRLAFAGPTSSPAGTLRGTVMADMELLTGIKSLRLNNQEKSSATMERQGRVLCRAEGLGVGKL